MCCNNSGCTEKMFGRIESLSVKSEDAIILYFNKDASAVDELMQYIEDVEFEYQNNKVIAIPNTMSLNKMTVEELTGWRDSVTSLIEQLEEG